MRVTREKKRENKAHITSSELSFFGPYMFLVERSATFIRKEGDICVCRTSFKQASQHTLRIFLKCYCIILWNRYQKKKKRNFL